MAIEKGTKATFRTIGGNTVDFVYEGGVGEYGRMACNGCKVNGRVEVGNANKHAAECRAQ